MSGTIMSNGNNGLRQNLQIFRTVASPASTVYCNTQEFLFFFLEPVGVLQWQFQCILNPADSVNFEFEF